MSQRAVEFMLGKLLTDDELRRRFFKYPAVAFEILDLMGLTLTSVERNALSGLDPKTCERFVQKLDARLRKAAVERDDAEKL